MLSLYLRFMFQFISIIYSIFNLIKADNSSFRNQCQSDWHYLSDETTCIIFATSQAGDVSWYDGYKACQTSSAELLTLTNSIKFQSIQNKINNEIYLDYIQRGAWIGKAKWSSDALCDSTSTTIEDLQLNCIILTTHSNDQSLCLKRVSCKENHPFICQKTPMTERELVESTMERLTWWKCFIIIWCLVDDSVQKEKKRQAAIAAEAANLEAYINQFNFDIPEDNANAQSLMKPTDDKLMISGHEVPTWLIMVIGGFIFLLMICICCTVLICIFIKINSGRSRQNPANRDGSFDSMYSTVSR